MMARVVNFIFTRTAIGRYLDGKKTILAAGLLATSALIEFVDKLAFIFPDAPQFLIVSGSLEEALQAVSNTLATVGFGGLLVGLGHKAAKKKLPDA